MPPPMSTRSDISVTWVTPHPPFTSPTTFSAGMCTSVRNVSLKCATPVIWRSGRTSTPSERMSTRKYVMPRCLGTSQSVRARRMPQSATCAKEFQTFWPLTIQDSPSSSARVVRPARSEPAPGSLKSWHHTFSPRSIAGMWASFCSSVPYASRVGHDHREADGEDAGVDLVARRLLLEDACLGRGAAASAVLGRAPRCRRTRRRGSCAASPCTLQRARARRHATGSWPRRAS